MLQLKLLAEGISKLLHALLLFWVVHHVLHGRGVILEGWVLGHGLQLLFEVRVLEHLGHLGHDFWVCHGSHGFLHHAAGGLLQIILAALEHVLHLCLRLRGLGRVVHHGAGLLEALLEFLGVAEALHLLLEQWVVHHLFGFFHDRRIRKISHHLREESWVVAGLLESGHAHLDITQGLCGGFIIGGRRCHEACGHEAQSCEQFLEEVHCWLYS
mmetsp:Transcript_1786/g.4939  ORF Transcript_1786/g.4939 Transcript_1786/m.4939 type:complete len:213 (-) Transcript_1786:69-707(-)